MKTLIHTIILLSFLSTSIAKSPFDTHKEKIKSLKNIYVLTDTLVVDDMKGQQIGLTTEYNYILGQKLFKNLKTLLASSLNANFIHVANTVGLYEQDNVYLEDSLDLNHKIILPKIDPSVSFTRQDDFLNQLNPLADRSFDMSRPTKMHKKYQARMLDKDFSRISRLNLDKDDAVLMLLTSGIKVPGKKTAGKAALVGILTLGMVLAIETSATNFNVVLMASDGTLLWAGKSLKAGKGDKDKKLLKLLKKSFKNFPIKLPKVKSR